MAEPGVWCNKSKAWAVRVGGFDFPILDTAAAAGALRSIERNGTAASLRVVEVGGVFKGKGCEWPAGGFVLLEGEVQPGFRDRMAIPVDAWPGPLPVSTGDVDWWATIKLRVSQAEWYEVLAALALGAALIYGAVRVARKVAK